MEGHNLCVVKLGSDERPASQEDIDNATKQMTTVMECLKKGQNVALVTHHAFEISTMLVDVAPKREFVVVGS